MLPSSPLYLHLFILFSLSVSSWANLFQTIDRNKKNPSSSSSSNTQPQQIPSTTMRTTQVIHVTSNSNHPMSKRGEETGLMTEGTSEGQTTQKGSFSTPSSTLLTTEANPQTVRTSQPDVQTKDMRSTTVRITEKQTTQEEVVNTITQEGLPVVEGETVIGGQARTVEGLTQDLHTESSTAIKDDPSTETPTTLVTTTQRVLGTTTTSTVTTTEITTEPSTPSPQSTTDASTPVIKTEGAAETTQATTSTTLNIVTYLLTQGVKAAVTEHGNVTTSEESATTEGTEVTVKANEATAEGVKATSLEVTTPGEVTASDEDVKVTVPEAANSVEKTTPNADTSTKTLTYETEETTPVTSHEGDSTLETVSTPAGVKAPGGDDSETTVLNPTTATPLLPILAGDKHEMTTPSELLESSMQWDFWSTSSGDALQPSSMEIQATLVSAHTKTATLPSSTSTVNIEPLETSETVILSTSSIQPTSTSVEGGTQTITDAVIWPTPSEIHTPSPVRRPANEVIVITITYEISSSKAKKLPVASSTASKSVTITPTRTVVQASGYVSPITGAGGMTPNPQNVTSPPSSTMKVVFPGQKPTKHHSPTFGILLTTLKKPVAAKTPPSTTPLAPVPSDCPSDSDLEGPDDKLSDKSDKEKDPPLYVTFRLKMSWRDFCHDVAKFQGLVAQWLQSEARSVVSKQVAVWNGEQECPNHYRSARLPRTHCRRRRESETISIHVYMLSEKDKYDLSLTEDLVQELRQGVLARITNMSPFHDRVLNYQIHDVRVRVPDVSPPASGRQQAGVIGGGVVVGIVVGALVGTCVLSIMALQLALKKRRYGVKKMRGCSHDSRYNMELHNIAEAIQLSGMAHKDDQFAYINPALDTEEKDLTSTPLTYVGLVNILKKPNVLEDEFLMLRNNMAKASDVPPGAEDKNRYSNVIPNPETRVPLGLRSSSTSSTCTASHCECEQYINANFVRGYLCAPKSYIATQAPMDHTREDFWQLAWEQQAQVILMLTGLEENGLARCSEYWPNTEGGDTLRVYGDYQVKQLKREVNSEWIMSMLLLKNTRTGGKREVAHFWLTAWPMNGLPEAKTIIQFLLEARPYMEDSLGPTIVHCSPGTGRTGTLIAIDIQMVSFDDTKIVDVLDCVTRLRQDRGGAVQSKDQYIFIYKVLAEYAKMLQSHNPSIASSMTSINHLIT